ncbi:hypothetical protein QFC21_002253 [Naganishia friedmannii]|uniref:Uncharacterized protein n=1 Tax=Naganishia friedmannii TaxID=89922 RepID=A0ACC2VXF3_9TREE|nr:hypothetical protein QFC21_002253 [Naganishia friedmannii]
MALSAAAVGFYEKLGFEVAGKPPMSSDGTLEGNLSEMLAPYEAILREFRFQKAPLDPIR